MQCSSRRAHTLRPLHVLASLCVGLPVLLASRAARADVSSWVFVGGGADQVAQRALAARAMGALRLDLGLGSDPSHPVVLGGLFSFQPHLGYGTDLALSFRTASRMYVNGGFGLALDLGGYERLWRAGSAGGTGTLWFGAPWGACLGVGASVGSHDAHEFSAIIGVDLARLTVYRSYGTSRFMNPFPAYRPSD